MGKFHLGISMAGTVSAGAYTAGCLLELNKWLEAWQIAKKKGVKLKAIKSVGTIKAGDIVSFTADEVPQHEVVISSMTGASGGGVSAALYVCGLSLGKVEEMLRDTWLGFDIEDMLDTSDMNLKKVYSLLNIKPIEKVKKMLAVEFLPENELVSGKEYLDDVIDIFFTLSSYEGIPWSVSPFATGGIKSTVHRSHMDYIRFGFYTRNFPNIPSVKPYRHILQHSSKMPLIKDPGWAKLIEASPATGAFPIGFKSRAVSRTRKEYDGQLFYLDYPYWKTETQSNSIKYSSLSPAWAAGPDDKPFDMEYFDGGAFNREPHDLARAALLQRLGDSHVPPDGVNTNAAVLLIDPFPEVGELTQPGEEVKAIPTLVEQIPLLAGAMMDQGRFHSDWIEKANDAGYYSRYLISPSRKDENGNALTPALAGGLLGAFCGFISRDFRNHDYELGHYNSYRFLSEYFTLPVANKEVDYYKNASPDLREKHEAVGWYSSSKLCQIIPRCIEAETINSTLPSWPNLRRDRWDEIVKMAEDRAKMITDIATPFRFLDNVKDWAIWHYGISPRFDQLIDNIADQLRKAKLMR